MRYLAIRHIAHFVRGAILIVEAFCVEVGETHPLVWQVGDGVLVVGRTPV